MMDPPYNDGAIRAFGSAWRVAEKVAGAAILRGCDFFLRWRLGSVILSAAKDPCSRS